MRTPGPPPECIGVSAAETPGHQRDHYPCDSQAVVSRRDPQCQENPKRFRKKVPDTYWKLTA